MPHEESIAMETIPSSSETLEMSLREVARRSAQIVLQKALEAEVDAYLESFSDQTDEDGNRVVVRNGHAPRRSVLTSWKR